MFTNAVSNDNEEEYINENEINILREYFITNKELEENPELELYENYSYIREDEENRIIEEMLEQEEKNLKKEVATNNKQAVILFIVIIAMIIAAILPSMINR